MNERQTTNYYTCNHCGKPCNFVEKWWPAIGGGNTKVRQSSCCESGMTIRSSGAPTQAPTPKATGE